ncbi:MAG: hypothetical protein K8S56_08690 [Candidatus Cloacimonetes bacterium]|nr:hypothetical protein [Candidatus Cloacimonadota bacterium]
MVCAFFDSPAGCIGHIQSLLEQIGKKNGTLENFLAIKTQKPNMPEKLTLNHNSFGGKNEKQRFLG